MSLNVIALNIGVTIALGLGGLLLLSYGYGALGFIGLFSVAAAAFYMFTMKAPLRLES